MTDNNKSQEHLLHGYERMLERARSTLEQARKEAVPPLSQLLDKAREKAVSLGELSREEAEKVAHYLRRDVDDAADHLNESNDELGDWLRFDMELIEERLRDLFSGMVDHTRLELDRLATRAREGTILSTGEVSGPGTLECRGCGQHLHFHRTGHIPPCPKCHGTEFRRPRKAAA